MGLVNTDWLRKNLLSDNIKILDCSWHMPNSERSGSSLKGILLKVTIPNRTKTKLSTVANTGRLIERSVKNILFYCL
jgi:3-mercaptopyruvate sulfurtransferase SseA